MIRTRFIFPASFQSVMIPSTHEDLFLSVVSLTEPPAEGVKGVFPVFPAHERSILKPIVTLCP